MLASSCLTTVPASGSALAPSRLVANAPLALPGMIGGQVADLEAEDHWPEDAGAALDSIHRRKTGALLTASIRLGGLYAGASTDQEDGLLARNWGSGSVLLFQIRDDDILDVER